MNVILHHENDGLMDQYVYLYTNSTTNQLLFNESSYLHDSHRPERKKLQRRRITTATQRKAANIRERKRMLQLNHAFDKLKRTVPTFTFERSLSRIETLKLAISYISFMTDLLRKLDGETITKFSQGNFHAPEVHMYDNLPQDTCKCSSDLSTSYLNPYTCYQQCCTGYSGQSSSHVNQCMHAGAYIYTCNPNDNSQGANCGEQWSAVYFPSSDYICQTNC